MTQVQDEQPQTELREVLLAIKDKRGALTPEIIVDEARNPLHPLHERFDWSDGDE